MAIPLAKLTVVDMPPRNWVRLGLGLRWCGLGWLRLLDWLVAFGLKLFLYNLVQLRLGRLGCPLLLLWGSLGWLMVNPINSLTWLGRCSLDPNWSTLHTRGAALSKPKTTRVTLSSLGALYDHL